MNPSDFAIDVRGVTKKFGTRTVVNDIAMQVKYGEIYGFLGPNGSGKTTFLRMLCGLLTPDGGEGLCLGLDFRKESAEIKKRVGYMTQKFSFYDDLTIQENLEFIARLYGMPQRKAAVEKSLERLGMVERRKQLAGTLSGGWKQRLALAACLIHDPKLLLLDEPTAGVDPKARRDFWEEIHLLAAEGLTFLITTHYMDEAERCHRLAYIAYGNLLASGSVEEVVKAGGLTTWEVTGGNLPALADKIRKLAGIEQVVAFGTTLHVSGHDAEQMKKTLAPFFNDSQRWTPIKSGLEDVFIGLMDTAKDNYS
ncbi:MAG TPA: ABC transporter ATP-binding protein [Candidatus Sulfotelmatobacter sp.]|jgi:ABC-2 type transport system ATP-binding protein|nr:ABC transporter ATP-binding protein [Candidatus Sulfotelmatobacter sp.]